MSTWPIELKSREVDWKLSVLELETMLLAKCLQNRSIQILSFKKNDMGNDQK